MKAEKRIVFLIAFVLLCTTLLQGCTSSSSQSKVIRIGYQKGDEFNITKIRGNLDKSLKKRGYKVKWIEFENGTSLLEALRFGSVDYGRTGNTPPIVSQASGAGLVYIGVGHSKASGSGIVVKKSSSIRQLKDLKNKKIAFAKGSSSHYLVVKALAKAGLTLKDITPVYLSPAEARIAFDKGKIDAWATWDPFTAAAETGSNARLLVNGEGLTTDRDFFLARSSFAAKNKKITKIVLQSVSSSMTWSNQHHKQLIKELSSALRMNQKTMSLVVNRRIYGVDHLSSSIMDEQQSNADTFYKLKLIPKKINVRDSLSK